jgi:hypothetical protein
MDRKVEVILAVFTGGNGKTRHVGIITVELLFLDGWNENLEGLFLSQPRFRAYVGKEEDGSKQEEYHQ